jgi:hypothetical protein
MKQVILSTAGNGLWSGEKKDVRIVDIVLEKGTQWEGERSINGELRVYFDTKTWDTYEDGLIYTDRKFERQLRRFLNAHSLPGKDVSYSEQGMQGDDYVSLDAGTKFYKAWMKKFGIEKEKLVEKW